MRLPLLLLALGAALMVVATLNYVLHRRPREYWQALDEEDEVLPWDVPGWERSWSTGLAIQRERDFHAVP